MNLWNKNIRCSEARHESIPDQITGGPGPKDLARGQSFSRTLFQPVFPLAVIANRNY